MSTASAQEESFDATAFAEMKRHASEYLVRGCTFADRGNTILVEQVSAAAKAPRLMSYKWLFASARLDNSAGCFAVNGDGSDMCGTGYYTDTEAHCAMNEMRRRTKAVSLAEISAAELPALAAAANCGSISLKGEWGLWDCEVTLEDGSVHAGDTTGGPAKRR